MIDRRMILATLGLSLAACGDDGGGGGTPPDAPDAPPAGNALTIEIHRGFPFVDGDTADEATFVAVQDGDGAFTEVFGLNGVYHVPLTSERYGIAVGCVDTFFASVEVVQQVVTDGTTYRTICKSRPATSRLDVTVNNLPAGDRLRLRTNSNVNLAASDGTVSIDVPPGTTELFGTLTDADRNVRRLFRVPAIEVTTSAAVTLDMVADGGAPESPALTVSPADPTARVRTAVVRPYGTVTIQGSVNPIGQPATYVMLPAALRQPDDLYRITVSGQSGSQSHTAKTPGPLAFSLPTQFTAAQPVLLRTPFLHPTFTFSPTTPALPIQSYVIDASNFSDPTITIFRDWFATLSPAWIAGAPSVTYEFPDLTTMSGFSEVALVDRERLDTAVTRFESTSNTAVDGAESTSSSATAFIGEFCGDGAVQAGELCDPGEAGETATCDSDCTAVECGDGIVNFAAGEDCDPPDRTTCSATCKSL